MHCAEMKGTFQVFGNSPEQFSSLFSLVHVLGDPMQARGFKYTIYMLMPPKFLSSTQNILS